MNRSQFKGSWYECVLILYGFSLFLNLAACRPDGEGATNGEGATGVEPSDGEQTVHYFTWSDYVDQSLLDRFEQRTNVRVVVDTFSSNEELLAKVQHGAVGYDVAVPSDFMVTLMAREGLLAPLDHSAIPNIQKIDERFRELAFDPAYRHSIPYLWGTVGIGYDSKVFPEPPDSWEVLWDERYAGRISMLNDQREVMGVAFRTLGYSLNETAPVIIEQAKKKLVAQKPLVKAYTSENYDHLLASGEVVLAHGWGGAVARAMRDRPSLRYVVPQEGGTIWADCLVILQSSVKQDIAAQFINYLLETEVAVEATTRLQFASANAEVREQIPEELKRNPAVYPLESTMDRLEWMVDVGEHIRLYDRAWTELKMQ